MLSRLRNVSLVGTHSVVRERPLACCFCLYYMTLPKSKSKKGTSFFFFPAKKKQPDVPVFLVTSGCLMWYK